jgi:hypothetical protein
MTTLKFVESKDFFKELDAAVKAGKRVTVAFPNAKPEQRSKLWPRLRRCSNWGDIQNQLDRTAKGEETAVGAIVGRQMVVGLTGGELAVLAWAITLVAGLIAYGIYKGRKIVLDTTVKPPKLELRFD